MAEKTTTPPGALYGLAAKFAGDLDAGNTAAADQMLAAWAQAYGRTRIEIDDLLAKVDAAKVAGKPLSPAWLYQQERLKKTLGVAKVQMAQHAAYASQAAIAQQQSAVLAALKHAEKLTKVANLEGLPGLSAGFTAVNAANLQHLVGFTADGSPLADLFATLPNQSGERLQAALVQGIALGKGTEWMRRQADVALDLPRHRAETIMRTEALRAYRSATRATYLANADTMEGWVWTAALDARTCVACTVMDGTLHSLDQVLDGHPRCRCAMVPRTKSWEDLTGQKGLEDTRPPLRSGKAWLKNQPAHVQRAVMGRSRFNAYTQGLIGLDDMVGRPGNAQWGTMRRERSVSEIVAGKNGNWISHAPPPTPFKPAVLLPEPGNVKALANTMTYEEVLDALDKPGTASPQQLVNLEAAKVVHLNRMDYAVALPPPDAAKVAAAVAKLNNAATTKGYPSKGYSQTKAVYKAHATGKVGQPVGPLKALTLQQKITAQAILEQHDLELPAVLRAGIKDAKVKAAAVQAEDDWYSASAGVDNHADYEGVYDDLYQTTQDAFLDAIAVPGVTSDSTAVKVILARRAAIQAKHEGYQNARATTLAKRDEAPDWAQPDGSGTTLTIDADGWGTFHYADGGSQSGVMPVQVNHILNNDPDGPWQPAVIAPEPAKVANLVDQMTDPDNPDMLDVEFTQAMEAQLPNLSLQAQANLGEAIAQAKATLLPPPNAQAVYQLVQQLKTGDLDANTIAGWMAADPSLVAMGAKSNLKAALAEWEAGKGFPPIKGQVDDLIASLKAVPPASLDQVIKNLEEFVLTAPRSQATANTKAALLQWKARQAAMVAPEQIEVDALVKLVGNGTLTLDDLAVMPGWTAQTKANAKAALAAIKAQADGLPPTPPVPTLVAPTGPPFNPAALTDTGQVLGTHGARVLIDPETGQRWLFKPPQNASDGFLATLDEITAQLQVKAGLKAPETYVVTVGGKRGSIQRMFDATDGFPTGFKPTQVSAADLRMIQREHVLDWLISNHDGHLEQFIRLPDGSLTAIDKGQAFRWFGQDRLDWDFHPNGHYGAPPPVYNALFREFAAGADVDLRLDEYLSSARAIQAISDDELRAMLRPYAEQAAAQGKLAVPQGSFPGVVQGAKLPTNDVDAFLDAVVARKAALADDFTAMYARAVAERQIAIPGWKPTRPKGAAKTGKAKWKDAEPPKPPPAPVSPTTEAALVFDTWLDKAEARYKTNPNKVKDNLEETQNWARFKRVIDDGDRNAVQELLDRKYLDQALADEALELIDKAEAVKAAAQVKFTAALAKHEDALKRHRRDLKDWREVNGITTVVRGMDENVLRHKSDHEGLSWAQGNFDDKKYTAKQRATLKSYTGTDYRTWNNHLRETEGKGVATYREAYDAIDAAMTKQAIPEDIILHRGLGSDNRKPWSMDGVSLGESDDLTKIIGSVQTDYGYMSTSAGNSAAFASLPIQMKLRVPAGTPGAFVDPFSLNPGEREIVLGRNQLLYIHSAYKSGSKWIVEAEIVDQDFFDSLFTLAPKAMPSPATTPWTR